MVCPLAPPKLKVLYSTLPTTRKPSLLSLFSNQLLNSDSVQLQLVRRKMPPLRTRGSTRSQYPSNNRRPWLSFSSLSDIASNVPLSSTTSHPSACGPLRTVSKDPAMTSHSLNSTPFSLSSLAAAICSAKVMLWAL